MEYSDFESENTDLLPNGTSNAEVDAEFEDDEEEIQMSSQEVNNGKGLTQAFVYSVAIQHTPLMLSN